MEKVKKTRLEARGWKVGTVKDLLELTPEELRYIDLKLALSDHFRKSRVRKKLTQTQVARLLSSSQSRVAKMEVGDPSVSLDLLIRSLIILGSTKKDLARVIASPRK